jgi:DNA polymerase V
MGPTVSAGFGNFAEPFEDGSLNLHTHVIENPEASFFMRAKGDSMQGAGIFDGDLLVVDRAVKPRPGHIVVAVVNEEFFVKRLKKHGSELRLASEAEGYGDIEPSEGDVVRIWGVVRAAVRQFAV